MGPRYCPSIEDKVNRFSEKRETSTFLRTSNSKCKRVLYKWTQFFSSYWCSKIYDSLNRWVRKCKNCTVWLCDRVWLYQPTWTSPYTWNKKIKNLYLAGQINATTGCQAASQGFIAGINAISVDGKEPFILRRDESYIGVLIDDLVTKGTNEPYRMFTSRAEYRLLLREESADLRLMEYGYHFGLINEVAYQKMVHKKETIENAINFMSLDWFTPKKRILNF